MSNEEIPNGEDNDILNREFEINLCRMSNNEANYTIERFIAALEATTTLTDLTVCFKAYAPSPGNNRRLVEPLCRSISNLRLENEHHPLRELMFMEVDLNTDGMIDVFVQFLIAAKQFGIFHMAFLDVDALPVKSLVEFCRNNNNLKVLGLYDVVFSSAMTLPRIDQQPQNSSVAVSLDKLVMKELHFRHSTSATAFANLIAPMNVSALELGEISELRGSGDDEDERLAVRAVAKFKMPSVEQLTLHSYCHIEHFKAALKAGTATVTELSARIEFDDEAVAAKMYWLTSMIRVAVKLNSLGMGSDSLSAAEARPLCPFIQAIAACATVTRIHVNDSDEAAEFSPQAAQKLQGIATRNKKLARFVANPSSYPINRLQALMRQFDNCPSGLYMLTRRLPEIFSFEKGDCLFPLAKQKRESGLCARISVPSRANRFTDRALEAGGWLDCRLNTNLRHLPVEAKTRATCQLHLWACDGRDLRTPVMQCSDCKVLLCIKCYKLFHTAKDLLGMKPTLQEEFEKEAKKARRN